jgi:hypothetical protein
MSALPLSETIAVADQTRLTPETVRRIVQNFIADHLGNLALAGIPRHMVFPIRVVWAVPIALAYPGYGLAGVIGVVAVDDELSSVIASTPLKEMRQAAEQLYAEHQTEIESAFRKVTSTTA